MRYTAFAYLDRFALPSGFELDNHAPVTRRISKSTLEAPNLIGICQLASHLQLCVGGKVAAFHLTHPKGYLTELFAIPV